MSIEKLENFVSPTFTLGVKGLNYFWVREGREGNTSRPPLMLFSLIFMLLQRFIAWAQSKGQLKSAPTETVG